MKIFHYWWEYYTNYYYHYIVEYIYIYCLVLWNMAFIFHNTSIWVVILPIDELICFKVVKTTKQ